MCMHMYGVRYCLLLPGYSCIYFRDAALIAKGAAAHVCMDAISRHSHAAPGIVMELIVGRVCSIAFRNQ